MHRHWLILLALALFGLPGLAWPRLRPKACTGAPSPSGPCPNLDPEHGCAGSFTEFDGAGKRYNDMHQTMGFSFLR